MPYFNLSLPDPKPGERQRFDCPVSEPAGAGAGGGRLAIGLQGRRAVAVHLPDGARFENTPIDGAAMGPKQRVTLEGGCATYLDLPGCSSYGRGRIAVPAPRADDRCRSVTLGDRCVLEVAGRLERDVRITPNRPADQAGAVGGSVAHGDGSARRLPPGVKLGLLGGADRPSASAEQPSEFFATTRKLRDLQSHYYKIFERKLENRIKGVIRLINDKATDLFKDFGGKDQALQKPRPGFTRANEAYEGLRRMAEDAEKANDRTRAQDIRKGLQKIDEYAAKRWKNVTDTLDMTKTPFPPVTQTPPATSGPGVTAGPSTAALPSAAVAAASPSPSAPQPADLAGAYRQLCALRTRYSEMGRHGVAGTINRKITNAQASILNGFKRYGGTPQHLQQFADPALPVTERRCLVLQDMAKKAESEVQADAIRRFLGPATNTIRKVLDDLALQPDVPAVASTQAAQTPLATAVPAVVAGLAGATERPQTVGAVPSPLGTPELSHWSADYRRLLALKQHFNEAKRFDAAAFIAAKTDALNFRIEKGFENLGGTNEHLEAYAHTTLEGVEKRCFALKEMMRDADYAWRVPAIHRFLDGVEKTTREILNTVAKDYGAVDLPSTQAVPISPGATGTPGPAELPVMVGQTAAVHPGQPGGSVPEHAIAIGPQMPPQDVAGGVLPTPEVAGSAPASSSPERLHLEIAGAEMEEFERWLTGRSVIGPPTATPAVSPATTAVASTPEPGEAASFWLQPIDPVPAAGTVPSDPGRHYTGEPAHLPPLAAESRQVQPQAMHSRPHPVPSDPWAAPPGPSSAAANTGVVRAPLTSTESPAAWQSAEPTGSGLSTPARPPLSRHELREEIVRRFSDEDEVLRAEEAVRTGQFDRLRWSDLRCRDVLEDLRLLQLTASLDFTSAVMMRNIDWPALEELMDFLENLPS